MILGPGDWSKGSSQMFEKVWQCLKYYSTGSTGYVDVMDVAECLIKLLNSAIINERFILNAGQIKYRKVFDTIAENLNKPKPYIKVTPFLKEIAWRVEWVKSVSPSVSPFSNQRNSKYCYEKQKFLKPKNCRCLRT